MKKKIINKGYKLNCEQVIGRNYNYFLVEISNKASH